MLVVEEKQMKPVFLPRSSTQRIRLILFSVPPAPKKKKRSVSKVVQPAETKDACHSIPGYLFQTTGESLLHKTKFDTA